MRLNFISHSLALLIDQYGARPRTSNDSSQQHNLSSSSAVCNLMFNSESQYSTHIGGGKHERNLLAQQSGGTPGAQQPPQPVQPTAAQIATVSAQPYNCTVCVSSFTSSKQLASHLCGSKHAKRVKMLPEGSAEQVRAS